MKIIKVKSVKKTTKPEKNPHAAKKPAKKPCDKFSWNVWTWSFNHDMLEAYDVVPVLTDAVKGLRKKDLPKNKEELSHVLNGESMYYFWAKCEYEMIITGWPTQKSNKKVDVYDQLRLNWDEFVNAFWEKVYKPRFLKKSRRHAS